jgi:general stress protein YciG
MKEHTETPEKKPRGFAAMDPERQREIASKGGRIAHLRGNAHEFTPEEAREAGRKGGQTVSRDRKHMARIGRLGGEARGHGQRTSGEGPAESQPPPQ